MLAKYEIPKILLVDVDEDTQKNLENDGFNIDIGTFGNKYPVFRGEECGYNCSLPLFTEKDIIIVDMNIECSSEGHNPLSNHQWINGDKLTFTSSQGSEYFNPSYRSADLNSKNFKDILNRGGVVIVFADKIDNETYYPVNFQNGSPQYIKPFTISNFKWLPIQYLNPQNCIDGKEIFFDENADDFIKSIFKDCEDEVIYKCIFSCVSLSNRKIVCKNKNRQTIAVIESYGEKDNKGFLIILPQFKSVYKPLKNLFCDFIPLLKPELFPDFVKNNWVDDEDYILPEVKELIQIEEKTIKEHEKKLKKIDEQIICKKSEYKYLTGLLTSNGYDDFLVNNVIKTLRYIGYENIINVDDIIDGNRQEDLRILDNGQFTIVEVKGHNANPTEDDCQALVKYISRNMRKENRTDIHGILIINHNKLKSPLDRLNPAFTKAQLSDAIRDNYTLVSTWELYNSVRLYQKGLIDFNDIDTGLHTEGLFKALPLSWQFLGKILHQFVNGTIACFYLEADTVNRGDELIIQNGNDYFKVEVFDMQINDENVNTSIKGDKLSINIGIPILKQACIYVKNKN